MLHFRNRNNKRKSNIARYKQAPKCTCFVQRLLHHTKIDAFLYMNIPASRNKYPDFMVVCVCAI